MAHVRQEANLIVPACVIGGMQVQVDEFRSIGDAVGKKDSLTNFR